MTQTFFDIICKLLKIVMIRTALSVCSDAVCLVVLLEAQLQLMQVHWSRVDPGALQVHTDTLTPLPPNGDSYFLKNRRKKKRGGTS